MSKPPRIPAASERVSSLLAQMTLEEKLAQLVGYWVDSGGEVVAPMQGEMGSSDAETSLAEVTRDGIGHYTRVYGTRPVDPIDRASWLWQEQRRLMSETRLGIPAIVHEECLTGLAAWQAATMPTPLAWGAAFDPDLVGEMAELIGETMHELGIHQGLAPVLDVVTDVRWGRVDECIGEDPYLVGTIGAAYVRGLQNSGVDATLKHFVGYSASRAGRNHAPVSVGPRELRERFLPPFEMAIRDGGVQSVMNSYTDIDGVPVAADESVLTDLLHDELGFDGVVVSDYFAVAFLEVMHGIAADRGAAAVAALRAGIDVELPGGDAYLEPLADKVRSGEIDQAYVDRAVVRLLNQKERLGLLNPDAFSNDPPASVEMDSARHRDVAQRLATRSIVLLRNDDATLPLAPGYAGRIALIGPNADRPEALQGCYSFANHVLPGHPGTPLGFAIPTVAEAVREALPHAEVVVSAGSEIEDDDRSGFDDAIDRAREADVAIVVVGDRAGLFGRGTVGEGNDVESLRLPGVQRDLVEAVTATGTPVIVVVVSGRPYELDWALDGPDAPAAVMQSFFPGEAGGTALAEVIAGISAPGGRLPVSLPRSAGAQPYSYLHPRLGGPSDVTSADSTPVRPFGFGLSYGAFSYGGLRVDDRAPTDGLVTVEVTVTNTGDRDAEDVVQLYGHAPVARVVRPLAQLIGYRRVHVPRHESRRVRFTVPTTRFSFVDRRLDRVVEPGRVELWVASHASASESVSQTGDASGGAIVNEREREARTIPGDATERAVVTLTGSTHIVTPADGRIVLSEVLSL